MEEAERSWVLANGLRTANRSPKRTIHKLPSPSNDAHYKGRHPRGRRQARLGLGVEPGDVHAGLGADLDPSHDPRVSYGSLWHEITNGAFRLKRSRSGWLRGLGDSALANRRPPLRRSRPSSSLPACLPSPYHHHPKSSPGEPLRRSALATPMRKLTSASDRRARGPSGVLTPAPSTQHPAQPLQVDSACGRRFSLLQLFLAPSTMRPRYDASTFHQQQAPASPRRSVARQDDRMGAAAPRRQRCDSLRACEPATIPDF